MLGIKQGLKVSKHISKAVKDVILF